MPRDWGGVLTEVGELGLHCRYWGRLESLVRSDIWHMR